MAERQCALCGQRFGRFDKSVNLSDLHPEYQVCASCSRYIESVSAPRCDENMPTARLNQEKYLRSVNSYLQTKDANDPFVRLMIDEIINHDLLRQLEIEEEEKQAKIEKDVENDKRYKLERHLVKKTTGIGFDGYRITEYHGICSGDCVFGTGLPTDIGAALADFAGEKSDMLANKLKLAKDDAMERLIKDAIYLGGNAIIGISFDVYPYGSMVGVSATGTSVTIEQL